MNLEIITACPIQKLSKEDALVWCIDRNLSLIIFDGTSAATSK
jgi:hypothetical protein